MISHRTFLIGCLFFLSSLTRLISAATSPSPFFTDVQLSDAYTGSTNCTDLDHWFLVEVDIFVPQGNDRDIYLTVPKEFGSLPNGSFPLKASSKTIGSVAVNDSNILKVSFDISQSKNTTASLNFLVQLTADAKEKIKSPRSQSYIFKVSTGSSFSRTINYVAKDLQSLTSNGGMYAENNTAWFTADIPLSLLNRAVTFTSEGTSNSSYQFNTSLTSLEIVVAVDAFNQPLRSYPFTAAKDKSDSSQIQLQINSRIDGGRYVRVKYYTKPLNTTTIGNTISLDYASGLSKRENSVSVSSNLYAVSQVNVQDADDEIAPPVPSVSIATSIINEAYETYSLETKIEPGVFTEIGSWVPILTLSSSQSSASGTHIATHTEEQRSSGTSSSESSVPSSSSFPETFVSSSASSFQASLSSSKTFSVSSQSSASSSTEPSASIVSSSEALQSSKRTSPSNAASSTQSATIASITTASTTAEDSKAPQISTKSNVSETYLTYSLLTLTLNGEVITFTSLYPVSTISEVLPTQGFYSNTTSSSSSAVLTATSLSSRSRILTSDPVSTIEAASQETSSTRPAKSSTVESSKGFDATSTISQEETKSFISSHTESFETYTVITKDEGAIVTSYISIRPVSTLPSSVASELQAVTTTKTEVKSSTTTSHKCSSTETTGNDFVSSSSADSTKPSTTAKESTKTHVVSSISSVDSVSVSSTSSASSSFSVSSNSSPSFSNPSASVTLSDTHPTIPPIGPQNSTSTTSLDYFVSKSSNSSLSSLVIQTQLTSTGQTALMTFYEGSANRALAGPTGLVGLFFSFMLFWF